MDVGTHLASLPKPVLVDTVYLAGRFLTHRLTWDGFKRQLKADVTTPYGARPLKVVASIVQDIEGAEGRGIEAIPMETRAAYVSKLDDLLLRQTTWPADAHEVDALLDTLRAEPL